MTIRVGDRVHIWLAIAISCEALALRLLDAWTP